MSWEDMNQEISHQRIAELHADAEKFRQVQVSKRRRQSRGRRWRLGRLLGRLPWPRGPTTSSAGSSARRGRRRDTMGPTRLYHPSLGR